MGASGAKGLRDVQHILADLPRALNAAVLVVLHRPWDSRSRLQEVLGYESKLPVLIASQGDQLIAGTIYIGRPSEHLTLAAKSFGELIDDPDRSYRNRTVDLLFHSVARHAGNRMIGVVLSGSLDDGSRGLKAIHHAGGLTMVVVPDAVPTCGMPENAIAYDGPIDLIGTPSQIADGIHQATNHGRRTFKV